jgi:hypothetical protein
MVYDWNGARARRIKLYKTSVALVCGTAVVALALLILTFQLHGF